MASDLTSADVRIEEFGGDYGYNRWARQPTVVVDRFEEFFAEIGV